MLTPEGEEPVLNIAFERNPLVRAKYTELREIGKEGEKEVVSRPKIQRVPGSAGGRVEFDKFYLPKLISIGPIHDGEPHLEQGERYKLMWTSMYLETTEQTAADLYERLILRIGELRQLFSEECRWRDTVYGMILNEEQYEETLSWKLMVDGCSVLQVLTGSPEDLKVSREQLVRVHEDLLLLENQIPFQVLKILCNDRAQLRVCMGYFLKIHGIWGDGESIARILGSDTDEDDPIHLLDLLRRALLLSTFGETGIIIRDQLSLPLTSMHLKKYRIGSVRELKAAGIRVKKRHTHEIFFSPRFDAGQLELPQFTVDGSTNLIFLNLIAYEMCPDFRNDFEISSCIVFLSSLIDQPEDVKELRSAGILINELASDREVADLFNRLDSILVPETFTFAVIRGLIQQHIESKHRKIKMLGWMRDAYNNYFRSPWTVIALLAATLGLVLTFIQTWFAIHPKGS